MTLLHDSPDAADTARRDDPVRRFRAATVEQALLEARGQLGPDVEVVDANRIRRGGVGGFFATDLGVELAIRRASESDGSSAADRSAGLTPDRGGNDQRADARGEQGNDSRHFGDDFEDRLASLDRAIYGDGAPSGIERLLERGDGTDGFERDGTATDAGTSDAADASFAEHLAKASAPQSLPPQNPAVNAGGFASTADLVELLDRTDLNSTETATERLAARLLAAAGAGNSAGPAATGPWLDATADDTIAPHEATEYVPAVSNRAAPTPRSGPGHRESELLNSADLAAGAVGRLINELAHVAPTDGRRVNQLARLTVSLTAADGSSVEFDAELKGSHDG